MTDPTIRIAAWSGPRNLSTAMMYAFAARGDCAVWDEPFYAPYLAATGRDHPMRAEILAAHETDPDRVARACGGPAPGGKPLFYQKHMSHHLLPGQDLNWFAAARHMLLIRHPARVLASYDRKLENPRLEDIGLTQQLDIVAELERRGDPVVVLDSTDLRAAPEPMLRALCAALAIPFDPNMTGWPAGGHAADGVWARHWYDAVHRSTGFDGAEGPLPTLSARLLPILEAALPLYRSLAERRLCAAA